MKIVIESAVDDRLDYYDKYLECSGDAGQIRNSIDKFISKWEYEDQIDGFVIDKMRLVSEYLTEFITLDVKEVMSKYKG